MQIRKFAFLRLRREVKGERKEKREGLAEGRSAVVAATLALGGHGLARLFARARVYVRTK